MKKVSLILSLLMIILLSACGGNQPAEESAPAEVEISAATNTPQPEPTATEPPPPTDTPMPTETPTPEPLGAENMIIFTSDRSEDGSFDLFLIDPDTLEITALDTGFNMALLPSWSPDGSQIVFAESTNWNLYTVNADGSEITQITDFRSNNADWSPDGNQLVFQSDHQNEPENIPDVYKIDLSGENLTELVDLPDQLDYSPRWSPDGSSILFLSSRSGNIEIHTMNPDGSNIVQVTEGKSPVKAASWSPDGQKIAFVYGAANATDVYVIDKSGDVNSVVRLTANSAAEDAPSWSPDGLQIVYTSDVSGNWDLWMVASDGSAEPVQLTDDAHYDAFPDWSPQ